jgi:hypothetical protein
MKTNNNYKPDLLKIRPVIYKSIFIFFMQLLIIAIPAKAQRHSSSSHSGSHSYSSHTSSHSSSHTSSSSHTPSHSSSHSSSSHLGSHSSSSHAPSHSSSHISSSHSGTHSTSSHTPTPTSLTHHRSNYSQGVARDSHGKIQRSESSKHDFMKQSGYPKGRKGYVVDHIKPLKEGGCDCPSNMQWQTIEEGKAKDKWE